ncbi:AraC family transcriptional regulator [Pseudomonas sp. UFMG81]|uniref:AraC family transcriptional regulator n=1 Tax=Pseudomonas sp. UFMG81 TaxID=2745936 RepID=UPI002B268CC2|nr:AraC family transcriptional regulator [Pseudomonas sp. UFMG81]
MVTLAVSRWPVGVCSIQAYKNFTLSAKIQASRVSIGTTATHPRASTMTSYIRGTALLGFDEFATAQGLDAHALLAECALGPVDPDATLAARQFSALLEACAQRAGNPLFGLQFGLQHGMRGIGSLLHVIQNEGSVGDVLSALSRYSHVHSSAAEFRLERQAGHARLLYQVTDADLACIRQTVELAMGMTAQLMQSLLKGQWHPLGMLLSHTAADVAAGAYRGLLGITPRFGNRENAWVFDASLLDVGLGEKDERLAQLMRQLQEELADITLQDLPWHVQKLIRSRMPHGRVTIEQVAADLNVSPRSLQRYLLMADTSYQELLDKTRQAMAMRLLRDASINLTQVAELLGYTQLSAFSRAFSRWHGISAQQCRRQLQRGQDDQHARDATPPPARAWPT